MSYLAKEQGGADVERAAIDKARRDLSTGRTTRVALDCDSHRTSDALRLPDQTTRPRLSLQLVTTADRLKAHRLVKRQIRELSKPPLITCGPTRRRSNHEDPEGAADRTSAVATRGRMPSVAIAR